MGRGPRVVVLGAGGLLGTELVPALRQAGGAAVEGLSHRECDVTDPESVARALRGAALVVNCAAWTRVDAAEAEPEQAFAVNARGAGHVARAAAAVGADLVHLSTDYVFDGTAGRPYLEDDPPCPLGAYGRSKRAGEEEVLASGARARIVRTAALYGDHGPNFFRAILERARRGQPLRVVADQVTSPTWSRDQAGQIAALAGKAPPGIYHATAHGEATWFEAAREALRLAGLDVPLEPISTEEYGAPAPRPRHSVLGRRALERLGLDRMRDWREALAEWLAQRARQTSTPPLL